MRRITVCVVRTVAGVGLLSVGLPASSHHSVALQDDMTREITVVGTVVDLEWRNPHAWLHLDVENAAGKRELWKIEFGSANSLYRRGWRPANLPVGSIVTVHGLPARDLSRSVQGDDVTLADGTTLFSGSNPEDR